MLDKFFKSIPIEKIYLGFRVRKDTVQKTINKNNSNLSNIITMTYISDTFHIFIEDNGKYYDPKLKKSTMPITNEELLSYHDDYNELHLNLSDYHCYNKNELYGVFGLIRLDKFIESFNNTDTLYDKPEIYFKKEEGLTVMAAEILEKDLNRYYEFKGDYINGPLLSKDEFDPYDTDYKSKEDFLNELKNKNSIQIKEYIKSLDQNKKSSQN